MNKILLIDDEPTTESTVRRLKIMYDLDISWVKSPSKGMGEIMSKKYKIIMLDIMMPFDGEFDEQENTSNDYGLETGIVILKKIKENADVFKNIEVIFCSARGEEIMDMYNLVEGEDYYRYFQKPYDTEDLYNCINYLKNEN